MLVFGHLSRPTDHARARARGLLAFAASSLLAASVFGGGVAQAGAALHPFIAHPVHVGVGASQLPVTSECLANFGIHCYNPAQFEKAYDMAPFCIATSASTARARPSPSSTLRLADVAGDLHLFDHDVRPA